MKINVLHLLLLFLLTTDGCDKESSPVCSTPIFPLDGSVVPENSSIELSWKASANAQKYDVYVGVGATKPTLVAADVSTTSYEYTVPSGIDISYTWYVNPKNSNGASVACESNATSFSTKAIPAFDTEQKIVNVLVLDYDPDMKFGASTKKLHEFMSWTDPHTLADGYINDVFTSSNNLIKYNIVEWRDLNEFPAKADGFVYTSDTYLSCMSGGDHTGCHTPDGLDYPRMIEDQQVVEGIDQDKYEEVWIFGAPYFGFWESAMAGPKAFYINGGVYDQVPSKKAFAIMGFSYERGVAEMIHDLCHRAEEQMSTVYGGWQAEKLTTSWARFAANQKQSGEAAVGSCHYPPNALADYDYANTSFVSSSAEDWINYPLLTGKKSMVNSETWGAPDYQRKYLNWWFNHLPRREGVAPDGKLNNWWKYIFEFNETILQ